MAIQPVLYEMFNHGKWYFLVNQSISSFCLHFLLVVITLFYSQEIKIYISVL